MVQILPEVPSFGTQFARALGGGLSQGLAQSGQLAQELMLEKYKANQKQALIDAVKKKYHPDNPTLTTPNQPSPKEVDLKSNFQPRSSPDYKEAETWAALDMPDMAKIAVEREKSQQKQFQADRDFHSKRSDKFLEGVDEEARALQDQELSYDKLEHAIQNMPAQGFTKDYLADLTGFEPLRSPEGTMFKYGTKEFLLSNIYRAGSRPNMWIEQQMEGMGAKIGRSKEANEAYLIAKRADMDAAHQRVDIARNLEDKYLSELGYVPRNIASLVDKEMQPYLEKTKQNLAYKFAELKERYNPDSLPKLLEVPKGTPLTLEKMQAIKQVTPSKTDEEREKIAKKLGYTIYPYDFYLSMIGLE